MNYTCMYEQHMYALMEALNGSVPLPERTMPYQVLLPKVDVHTIKLPHSYTTSTGCNEPLVLYQPLLATSRITALHILSSTQIPGAFPISTPQIWPICATGEEILLFAPS